MRSSSPVSGVAPVAAATHGGATYFLGPGQGISSLPHAFNSSGGRNESRIVRGQFPAGITPLGSRFLPDQLREELRRRHAMVHAQVFMSFILIPCWRSRPEIYQLILHHWLNCSILFFQSQVSIV